MLVAGVPSLSAWTVLSTPVFGVLDNHVPCKGSPNFLGPGSAGSMQQATIRNSHLWTCRVVEVNSTNGAANADRHACEWLNLSLSGTSATLADSGRVLRL